MNRNKSLTAIAVMMVLAIFAVPGALADGQYPDDYSESLRLYGEDGLSAAFPYMDPEAPFDPQSDEAPPKDFVVFNPAYVKLPGLYVNGVDTREKVFAKQWFVPMLEEPVGRVWIDDVDMCCGDDVVTEYTYMFVDKDNNPTYGTAQRPGTDGEGSYWTRFWMPVCDNDDAQIGIDGCDVNFDGDDDWIVLRDVGYFDEDELKDIDISTETFELVEGQRIQFLDHMIEVVNVNVLSGSPQSISMMVDIYYLGNDEPERIHQNFVATILPDEYVGAGRHTADNNDPNFCEPWYIKAIATGGDRAYVQVGRLLHTGETFFVDGAEYDVAMIYGPTEDSLKYITIRNPVPEDRDVEFDDLSITKECVMDGEILPLLPPFNRVHDMIDDINIPDCADDPCPRYYLDNIGAFDDGAVCGDVDQLANEYDTVQERRINDVPALEIYFTGKNIEPRFNTNLLEILDEEISGTTTKPVDILFEIDLTGSMGGELDAVKANSTQIMNNIMALAPDSRFGLVSFMDYPGEYSCCEYTGIYGASEDYPYALDQPLTDDTGAVTTAINGLTLGSGVDDPECYTRVLYEAENDPAIDWRDDAVKIVIIFGDAPTHDCDFYGDEPGDSTGCDPGRDADADTTADNLDFETVVADLASQGIIVLAVDSSKSPSPNDVGTVDSMCAKIGVLDDDDSNAEMSFRYMADKTGGAYCKLGGADDLPDVVLDLITGILPFDETWNWLDIHTMPDVYKEFVYPELPDCDDGTGDFLLVSSWEAPNSCGARVMFVYDRETGVQDIYVNDYDTYNALRLYGEDESFDAAFPYIDPEAPFDPQSDEAPGKDFVTFNPSVVRRDGIHANGIDSMEKVFARQWFIPYYEEPVGDVWIDDPSTYESEDVITEYTYMFIDKDYMPTYGTVLSPGGSFWTRFWMPVCDNDDAQIGIDGCDIDGDSTDDWVVLRDVGDFDGDGRKDIDISSETFELYEGEELTFLDHKMVVKNVNVLSGSPPSISMMVDIYYLGNDEPELIHQNFVATILPDEYVRAGRHMTNNAAPDFYEPWYIKAISTSGDRAYAQVGRLLHTGETFFVDGAEYDVAMIYGPEVDQGDFTTLKYITIRNPVPEDMDVDLEDLSVIKECVMDGELLPLLPPFNRVHEMVDDINIPDCADDPCPQYYPDNIGAIDDGAVCGAQDRLVNEYDTVEERIISDIPALEIYFTGKDIETRFDTNLLEILNEGEIEHWMWLDIHTMPDFYKEFVYPELPDIDGGEGDWLVTSSFVAPNSCDARVMFAYDAADGTGLYMKQGHSPDGEPDLVITAITCDDGSIGYTVKNIGDADAGTQVVGLYIDGSGSPAGTDSVGSLAPDASYTGSITYQYTGTITAEVCADINDAVDESNEGNNCMEVTCGGPSDWNPWDDDCDIENSEISNAVYYWKTVTPINGHTVTNSEMSLLVYQWKTGDVC